jgi:hypothetical protein
MLAFEDEKTGLHHLDDELQVHHPNVPLSFVEFSAFEHYIDFLQGHSEPIHLLI